MFQPQCNKINSKRKKKRENVERIEIFFVNLEHSYTEKLYFLK